VRQAALEALAGGALEGLGDAEYNPFLVSGEPRGADDEAAGLALAATIAGGGDADDDAEGGDNPFVSADAADDGNEGTNPFHADVGVAAERSAT
jgi:hypothetical protein